jgi:predicted secreted hydrolase
MLPPAPLLQHARFCVPLFFWALLAAAVIGNDKTKDGFALPQKGRAFHFPRDHGSHPEFRTEWWYVTGHLDARKGGQRYGFQLTFFRQAQRQSSGVIQMHLAHAALMDAEQQVFLHEEKLQRAGWAAAASETGLHVHQDHWFLRQTSDREMELGFTVKGEAAVELKLQVTQPLVVFGKEGVSQKGASAEAASHYLTFPRLKVQGTVKHGTDLADEVTGEAWMDHEFSSSQLDEGQAGWDWAALQLENGQSIMAYRMRRTNGSTDPASSLTLIQADSKTQVLSASEYEWRAVSHWQSPHSQARYPNEVSLRFQGKELLLRPVLKDQEQGGSITGLPYWEGACDVMEPGNEQPVGRAFLELAGYAGNLSQHLAPTAPAKP